MRSVRAGLLAGDRVVWNSIHGDVDAEVIGTDQHGIRIRYHDSEGRALETIADPATIAAYASPSSLRELQ